MFALIKKKNYFNMISWKCDGCKAAPQPPSNQELHDLIKVLQTRLDSLESNTEVKNSNAPMMQSTSRGLSESKIPKPKMTHQIIVTTDGKEPFTRKTFADKVKDNLRTVPISNIKVGKDGCGIIDFPNKVSRDDGISKLKENFPVQANNRPHRSLLPKITISNIDGNTYNTNDTEKLKQSICEKNPTIRDLIEKGNEFDILFMKEDVRGNSIIAVVRVDQHIYEEVQKLKFQLYIDFNRCKVTDRFHVTQCYGCQKFGHTRNPCPSKQNGSLVCRYCTSDHESKNCPHKGDHGQYKCANCGLNHTSTYFKCAMLQKHARQLVNKTQGMENYPKNELSRYVIVT